MFQKKRADIRSAALVLGLAGFLAGCGSGSDNARLAADLVDDCMQDGGERKGCECLVNGLQDGLSKDEFQIFGVMALSDGSTEEAMKKSGKSLQEIDGLEMKIGMLTFQLAMKCGMGM